jgi:hypothetical protein
MTPWPQPDHEARTATRPPDTSWPVSIAAPKSAHMPKSDEALRADESAIRRLPATIQ